MLIHFWGLPRLRTQPPTDDGFFGGSWVACLRNHISPLIFQVARNHSPAWLARLGISPASWEWLHPAFIGVRSKDQSATNLHFDSTHGDFPTRVFYIAIIPKRREVNFNFHWWALTLAVVVCWGLWEIQSKLAPSKRRVAGVSGILVSWFPNRIGPYNIIQPPQTGF